MSDLPFVIPHLNLCEAAVRVKRFILARAFSAQAHLTRSASSMSAFCPRSMVGVDSRPAHRWVRRQRRHHLFNCVVQPPGSIPCSPCHALELAIIYLTYLASDPPRGAH